MDVTLNDALAKSEDIASDNPGEILWNWGSHHAPILQYVVVILCCVPLFSDVGFVVLKWCGWLTLVCVLLVEKQEEEVADALGDDEDDEDAAADTPGGFFWNQLHLWPYSLEQVNMFSTLL